MLLSDFEHRPGVHCGSVAMADLLRYDGIDLSEPMVFGLGSGLAFYLMESDHLSPSRQIMGRHITLEENVARALGLELVARRTRDADQAWADVKAAIDEGRPVLVQCDLSELPYWESSTPFNGHRIVVAGYDPDTDEALVADTHFEGLQRVAAADLKAARSSQAPPSMGNQNVWWTLEPGPTRDLAEAIPEAIARNADQMENDPSGHGGVEALRRFADTVTDWHGQDDAAWCYRFAAQVIEKRGTGGGMFRVLYRDFLREAADYDPSITRHQYVVSMTRVAETWSTLARYLDAQATWIETDGAEPDEDPAHHVESMAEAVYQFESTFWDRVGE